MRLIASAIETRTHAVAPPERGTSCATCTLFRAALHKGAGRRVYQVDEVVPGWWHCEIAVGVGIHTRLIEGRRRAQVVAEHFQQQVDELIRNGWVMQ